MPAMRNLNGMVVVVTGASAGIGRALAGALSPLGARLVLAARRVEKLDDLNRALGGEHLVVPTDVADPDACRRLIDAACDRFGRLDTLVCNAGYGHISPVAGTTGDEMRRIFAVNVFGTTDCIEAAVPRLREQAERDGWRGQVVIVSSAAARRGLPYFGAYSATKAAQLSLAEAMRVELEPDRIAVTSVHPVGTKTDFFDTAEAASGTTVRAGGRQLFTQTAGQVADAMVAAIRRPTAEVWPFRPARLTLSLGTMIPRLVDRGMAKMREQIDRENGEESPRSRGGTERRGEGKEA